MESDTPPPARAGSARRLGSTGLRVSGIGLGLAALGRPAYINLGRERDLGADRGVATLEGLTHRVLSAAYQAGLRYIDVARSYGRAEAFLGSWLEERRPDVEEVTVGSKWGYRYVGDWRLDTGVHEIKDHSLAALEEQLAESRANLGHHLHLYQIHSATPDTGVLEDRRVLARLVRLRAEGVAVGLTVSGPGQADTIRRALEVEVDGVNPFQTVQATWNLLETSAGAALAEAHAAGWGVIVKEALANGRLLTEKTPPELASVAEHHGVPVDALAIAAALAQPWADVVLSGAVTVPQLAGNLRALEVTLGTPDLDALAGSALSSQEYWKSRSTLPWQ